MVFAERGSAAPALAPDRALTFPSIGLVPQQAVSIPGWEEPSIDSIFPPHRPKPTSKLEELRTRRRRADEERRRQGTSISRTPGTRSSPSKSCPAIKSAGGPGSSRDRSGRSATSCRAASRSAPSTQWNDPQVRRAAELRVRLASAPAARHRRRSWLDVGRRRNAELRDPRLHPATCSVRRCLDGVPVRMTARRARRSRSRSHD